jgi:hypothetical protein
MKAMKGQSDEAAKGRGGCFLFPSSLRRFVASSLLFPALSVLTGCTYDSSSGPPPGDRQAAALKDPMNYKPEEERPYDISGGGVNNLDKKAFKRDLDDVLNP